MVYRMRTPITADPQNRYSGLISTPGLGDCDLPISIENIIVTPIPGRYDFRVLTFKATAGFTATPIEQD
jgi:hypothetical protein